MRDSSLDAYEAIKDVKAQSQRKVYQTIFNANKPLCDRDIADMLGWTINRVTPRRNELESMGKIISVGRMSNTHSNIKVHHFTTAKTK